MNEPRERNEYRLVALFATLIISAGILLIILNSYLHYQYPPEDMKDLAALEQDSIMFGGEYVMLGTSPEAVGEESDTEEPEQVEEVQPKPDVAGEDLNDAGEPAKQAKPVVTAKAESPMKVKEKPKEKEKPKKTGPATDEKPAEKQEQVKRGTDAATENKVKNAFGKASGSGSGKQGSPNGNSDSGALSGKPGTGVLGPSPQPVDRNRGGSRASEHPRQDSGGQVRGRQRRSIFAPQRAPVLRAGDAQVGFLSAKEHYNRGYRNRDMALCGLTQRAIHALNQREKKVRGQKGP